MQWLTIVGGGLQFVLRSACYGEWMVDDARKQLREKPLPTTANILRMAVGGRFSMVSRGLQFTDLGGLIHPRLQSLGVMSIIWIAYG